MARMNAGYGSELHLLRMLGRHRRYFDRLVLTATGADTIEWCDFPSGEMHLVDDLPAWDGEWQHLNFLLPDGALAKAAWDVAWPAGRRGPNWDAIGRLGYGGDRSEWLLIEAKANVEELRSDCQAKDQNSVKTIKKTLADVKASLGVPDQNDWMKGYYQYRLAALGVLNGNGSPAQLMYVYFCGDHGGMEEGRTRTCPATASEWDKSLRKQEEHVGLPAGHPLESRIHKIFVDTRCPEANA